MCPDTDGGELEREVPARLSGERLDTVLAQVFPERSRAALQKLVRRGLVLVDGERVLRSNIRPRRRARIRVDFRGRVEPVQAAHLEVLFEDEYLAVINKPAGLLTHGNESAKGDSLADLAVRRFGRLPILMGEHRPGIVHRLDRETSGVIIVARSGVAMEQLREAFRERAVRKDYLAIVHGTLSQEEQMLTWDLGPVDGHKDRQQVLSPGRGKSAETQVDVLEVVGPCSLVRCRPRTGRRHQIRVHVHAAGAPIVGDKLYGAKRAPRLPEGAPSLREHALHALGVRFTHPMSGEEVQVEAPLRPDMQALVDWLRANASK